MLFLCSYCTALWSAFAVLKHVSWIHLDWVSTALEVWTTETWFCCLITHKMFFSILQLIPVWHANIFRVDIKLSDVETLEQSRIFWAEGCEGSVVRRAPAACSSRSHMWCQLIMYTQQKGISAWSNESHITGTWCKITEDGFQVTGNELHPVILYITELLTLWQLSGNKCNLYGNERCLVTSLSVSNGVVHSRRRKGRHFIAAAWRHSCVKLLRRPAVVSSQILWLRHMNEL